MKRVAVQLLSGVWLFATRLPYPSLFPGASQIHVHWVGNANHVILSHPVLLLPSVFPSIRVLSNESAFASGNQSIRTSASIISKNIKGTFPLVLTHLNSFSKGLLRVFSAPSSLIRTYKEACSQSLCPQKTLVCLEEDINRWPGIEYMVKIKQKGE